MKGRAPWFLVILLLYKIDGFLTPPRSVNRVSTSQRWIFAGKRVVGGGNISTAPKENTRPNFPLLSGGNGHKYQLAPSGKTAAVAPSPLLRLEWWKVLLAAALVVLPAFRLQMSQACFAFARQSVTWYLAKLYASPLITKSLTSGFLGVCGDCMAQWIELRLGKKTQQTWSYDRRRGVAALIESVVLTAPLMHYGYNFMESIIPTGRSLAAMAHVLADTILLDSLFCASAILSTGLLEGYRLRRDILPQFKEDYMDTLKASWVTSTALFPVEYLCFRYLPVAFRTLAVNLMDLVWDGVISFMAHKSRRQQHNFE